MKAEGHTFIEFFYCEDAKVVTYVVRGLLIYTRDWHANPDSLEPVQGEDVMDGLHKLILRSMQECRTELC